MVLAASGGRFESFLLIWGWIATLLGLALIRLLSEIRFRTNQKEVAMASNKKRSHSHQSRCSRKFWQYICETIWAVGAGAMAAPLATLS